MLRTLPDGNRRFVAGAIDKDRDHFTCLSHEQNRTVLSIDRSGLRLHAWVRDTGCGQIHIISGPCSTVPGNDRIPRLSTICGRQNDHCAMIMAGGSHGAQGRWGGPVGRGARGVAPGRRSGTPLFNAQPEAGLRRLADMQLARHFVERAFEDAKGACDMTDQ